MKTFPCIRYFLLILVFWSRDIVLCGQENLDTVDLDTFEIQGDYQPTDLEIDLSSSVIHENLLATYGATQLQDLSGLAPNLYTSNADTRGFGDVISMRGNANTMFFSSPAVALYIDDIPSTSVSTYPSDLLSIANLTVHSGPQVTRYGRNAPAGVIEIRSREPTQTHFTHMQIDAGSYDSLTVKGALDGPINEEIGYNFSFGYLQRDGYLYNTFLDRTADDREALSARGNLFFRPSEDVQLRLGFFVESADDDATRLSSLLSEDPYQVASDFSSQTVVDRGQVNSQYRKLYDWGRLVATTSFQRWELNPSSLDLDFSPAPISTSLIVGEEETFTQEIWVESLDDGGRMSWKAGVLYFDAEYRLDFSREFAIPPSQFLPPGIIQMERTDFEIGQLNLAAYGDANFAVSDETSLNLGVRVDQFDASLFRTGESSNNFMIPLFPPEPDVDTSREELNGSVSGGASIAIKENLELVFRSSLAQQHHGYSSFAGNPELLGFESADIWANEIGLDFSGKDGRTGASILVFHNRTDDYQFERTVPMTTDFLVINAEEVKAQGLEAKIVFSPLDNFYVDVQTGYNDVTFARHTDGYGLDVSGNQVPFIPEYTFRTGARWELDNGIFSSVTYTAFGDTFFDEQNNLLFSQSSYSLLSAQLGYRTGRFSFTLYGHNITDELYYQFINRDIYAGSPGAPQRFGLRMNYIF